MSPERWVVPNPLRLTVCAFIAVSSACTPSTNKNDAIEPLVCDQAENHIAFCEEKHEPAGGEIEQWVCTNTRCTGLDFRDTGCYAGVEIDEAKIKWDGPCVIEVGPVVDGNDSSTDSTQTNSSNDTHSTNTQTSTSSTHSTSETDDTTQDTDSSSDTTSSTPSLCQADSDCMNAGTPICDVSRGVCVACLADAHCPTTAPLCDRTGSEPSCVGCTELWGQCPNDMACQILPGLAQSGQCLADVRTVAKSGTCSDLGAGTPDQPFCTLTRALQNLTGPATIRVPGGGRFAEALVVGAGVQIALVSDGAPFIIGGIGLGQNLSLASGSAVILDRVEVSGAKAGGIAVADTAKLWLQHSQVRSNTGDGITVSGAQAHIFLRQATLAENTGYGIAFGGRTLDVQNTIIAANGSVDGDAAGGVWLGPDADFIASYLSIGSNRSKSAGSQMRCDSGTRITLFNGLLLGVSDSAVSGCNRVEMHHTAHSIVALQATGDANKLYTDALEATNAWFIDPTTGDLRLRSPATEASVEWLRNVALRRAEDPSVDIEEGARPAAGMGDWPGADRAE